MKKIIIVLIVLCVANQLTAQDFHLTQYEAAPQYFNPALTGIYFKPGAGFRVNVNHRSQWRSVTTKPYTTDAIGYDQVFMEKWGLGGLLINNRSGIGHFNSLHGAASVSYRIIDDLSHTQNLSVGLQLGFFTKSYDPSNFLFEDQYSAIGGGLDPNLTSVDAVGNNSIIRFDASLGIYYKYNGNEKYQPFGGFSIYHVTMPNESFTGDKRNLPMRFVLNVGSDLDIVKGKFKLTPSLLYMNQAKAQEIVINVLTVYHIKDTEFDFISGLGYRVWDAIIFNVGVKYADYVFRMSYDVNTSPLNEFSGGRGAWELSLVYSGKYKGKGVTTGSFN
ncbi:MAG: PorP/SprF family type IX secretion system membrane protein [Flavobacteriales bacterium]|nr:PorP/SprF family type IX secretion system membrane protein [Flavobacteriales bacterium]